MYETEMLICAKVSSSQTPESFSCRKITVDAAILTYDIGQLVPYVFFSETFADQSAPTISHGKTCEWFI